MERQPAQPCLAYSRSPERGLDALGRFGKYKGESENQVRGAELREEKNASLKKAWMKYLADSEDGGYGLAQEYLAGLDYSAEDVKRFSLSLPGYLSHEDFSLKAGIFLCALVDCGKDREYLIDLAHLSEALHDIGKGNTKKVLIEGDVKDCLGIDMEDGCIILSGNAGDSAGYGMKGGTIIVMGSVQGGLGEKMRDGTIIVRGNAGDDAGVMMQGGEIIVFGDVTEGIGLEMAGGTIRAYGNAGGDIGQDMKGGEIHLHGKSGGISERVMHGRIFHEGILIVDK